MALAACTIGCQPAATNKAPEGAAAGGHDHSQEHAQEPASLAEAVKQLQTICTTIKDAFAKDDSEAAHGPLHDVGHILEHIPEFLDKSSLDAATKEEAKKATENIFQALKAVDEGMHGGEGKKYADVAETIEAGLKTLGGLAQ